MKRRVDGSRSFSNAKLPSTPNKIHLQQIAFYAVSKSPCVPSLVYISADGFKLFTPDNCADLEKENLRNYYEQLVQICERRERMLSRYAHINDTDTIIKELVADTDPQFSHPFFWNIGLEFLKKAKEVWSNNK